MVGWTSLSLVPNDEHSAEELQERFVDGLGEPMNQVTVCERDGTRLVHVYVRGYEAQLDGNDNAGHLLDLSSDMWDYGARIDANNTTDSGDGWAIGVEGDEVVHDERIEGVECANAADVADELSHWLGFRPPVRRV